MENHQSYQISLPIFKGPFDLLLFFIQRDELDIADIPISQITNDFLEYIQKMQELNIELASEFILVAASLMKIKAQMLLPRKELDEDGQEIDPRKELVDKILEYKQFKMLSETLTQLENESRMKLSRMQAQREFEEIAARYQTQFEMEHVSVAKLMQTFQQLLKKKQLVDNPDQHEIVSIPFDIMSQKKKVLEMLQTKAKISFEALFETIESRLQAIYHFLAILELVQEQLIQLTIGEGINQFWVSAKESSL